MKTLLSVLAIVLITSSVKAQSSDQFEMLRRYMNKGNTVTSIDSSAYSTATIDTSKSYFATPYTQHFVGIQAYDSLSALVGVQLSRDGESFSPTVVIDSVTGTSNSGVAGTVDISSKVNGFPYYKVVIRFNSGTIQGLSSPRYNGLLIRKNQ